MSTALKENYEKLLLASLLIALATTSIVAIIMVRDVSIGDLFGNEGKSVQVDSIPNIEVAAVGIDENSGPNSLEGFVYCRNSKCDYLINKGFQKCNWCSTPIVDVEEISDDLNKNSISDKLELSWGLKLDDPNEILRDQDKDGFSTITEYERSTSPIDSSTHPPVILRSSFTGIEYNYIPFTLNDVVIIKDVKGNIKVYVDAKHKKRGGFYLLVGEETDWLKVLSAGEKNGEKYAILKYFEKEIRIVKGKPLQYEGWPKYIIKNHLSEEKIKVSLGQKFSLKSLSGSAEIYKLLEVNRSEKYLTILDQEIDNKYKVGESPELKVPLQ